MNWRGLGDVAMTQTRSSQISCFYLVSPPVLWRAVLAVILLAQSGCGTEKLPEAVRPVIRRDPEAEELLKVAGLDAACFRIDGGSFEVWPDGGKGFEWCRRMSQNHVFLSLMTGGENVAPSDMKKEGTVIILHEADGGWRFALSEKRTWKAAPAEQSTKKKTKQADGNDIGSVLAEALTRTSGSSSATGGYGFNTELAGGALPGKDGQRLVVNLEQVTDLGEKGVVIATIEVIGEGKKVLNSLPIRCALVKPNEPISPSTPEQPVAGER